MLNTRHLRAFLTVAQSGSVVRSSQAMRRAQSAVTRAIKELEKDLDVPLFERHPHGVLLTAFGRALLGRVERAFAEMDAARSAFEAAYPSSKSIAQAPIFALSIGRRRLLVFVELVEQHHMGAVAHSLGISQPGASQALREIESGLGVKLTVSTIEASFEHLAMRLRAGDVDLILGALRDPVHTVGFVREVLAHDHLSLVVRKSHPLSGKRHLAPSDLDAANWVLPPRGTPTRELLEGALAARGLGKARVTVETADLAITRGLLTGSDMITAVSAHLYHHEIAAKTLTVLPIALPETRRPIGILRRAASPPALAAKLLMDQLRDVGRL